jgi:carbamoyltransferase
MVTTFGRYGPTHAALGRLSAAASFPAIRAYAACQSFLTASSKYARKRSADLADKLRRGETTWLLGIGPAGHNSGVALVEVSADRGVNLIRNNEEERYSGIKNSTAYPRHSLNALMATAANLGVGPGDIHACVASWDYVRLASTLVGAMASELPASRIMLDPAQFNAMNAQHIRRAFRAPARLGRQLGLPGPMPIIGMRHHGNHAYFSHAVSPFAASDEPVLITVADGIGDDGAISIYLARDGAPKLLYRNRDIFDSLGGFYSVISSTQGGWTILSSEGRFMGAVAWGDNDRMTNPFYRGLREIFQFAPNGEVKLNRALANWPRRLQAEPYTKALAAVLGEPIPLSAMWNPDAVLKVDANGEASNAPERFDKAAATQLVFEDVLFHIVDHHIRSTGASRLVLTGGTALNALANMRLMEHFDAAWYRRNLGRPDTCLHIWVPPIPGDPGAGAGAAYQFAMLAGAKPGLPLRHAFYCGTAPTNREIEIALDTSEEIGWQFIGSVASLAGRERVADFLASCIAADGVLGLFQGVAETGPRALGHRSILANPCNPRSLETINRSVKFREPFRPLAPMATLDAAHRFWFLREGALDDDANAYSYMVLTARPKRDTKRFVPAVVHLDDTSRIQIVRPDSDPFTYAYLRAMGRWVGAEVSVNTSLNVAGPIVQTPEQALEALRRTRAMDGLLLIGEEGGAYLAWHTVTTPPKDGGLRLTEWLARWREAGAMV